MSSPDQWKAAKPYKGPESYQVEDSDIFYGRDREAEQLIAKVLSARFTLVHAQSGAGKTSLLNARVIPELEVRGWSGFRVLLQNDPTESLRETTLRYVLPPPGSELAALRRAAEQLAPGREDITLGELLGLYDRLGLKDERRRALVGPVPFTPPATGFKFRQLGDVAPVFSRLLRSHVEIESLSEHLGVIWLHGGTEGEPPQFTSETGVAELSAALASERLACGYERLFEELDVPVRDLRVFFENLCEVYGARRSRFALVIILDQFEEMFTRFVESKTVPLPGAPKPPDWRLRIEFFEQFARLYTAGDAPAGDGEGPGEGGPGGRPSASAPSRLPIRYVISMRDEYIAHLDQIRPLVGSFDDVSFHLNLLEREQAKVAIGEPARRFGYSYTQECYEEIVKQLTKEDRFVEPAHLQLVCERLWNVQGAELSRAGAESDGSLSEIPLETFRELGGTEGILKSFFRDFLESLDENERPEALEMLEPLVTASGTRNIVERSALVDAPFRYGERRERLLKTMADHTIVRTERRLGGFFVEITHEFLIGPILEAMRETLTKDVEYTRFRWAIRSLERLQGAGRDLARLLSQQEFQTLHEQREEIRWNRWGMEVMIQSAISQRADREALRYWLTAYNSLDQARDALSLLEEMMVKQEGRDLMSLADLRLVNQQRETVKLSPPQVEYVLRSTLATATDAEREQIDFWTKRMLENAK
jgi:hypothetical protein